MKYYLGVDQGGTKTAAAVCDEKGTVLGFGMNEGLVCSYLHDDEEIYIQNLTTACRKALEMAGLDFQDVFSVCGALNGADWDFEYIVLASKLIKATQCRNVTVINDSIGAMRGGSLQDKCAVFCAGTGGNIAVCNGNARHLIFGYYIPERLQGANALGRMAFDAVLEETVGAGEKTVLTGMVLDYTGYQSVQSLYTDITIGKYSLAYKNLAEPLLLACSLNDSAALKIADSFAKNAAHYLWAGIQKVGLADSALDIVYSGSIFKDNGTMITKIITSELMAKSPRLNPINAEYEPVCGTLLTILATENGGRIPPDYLENFRSSSKKYPLIRNIQLKGLPDNTLSSAKG